MNTADRSIALVDHALRRRFAFVGLQPQYEVLRKFHSQSNFSIDKFIEILFQLNKQIAAPHYEVGLSFFLLTDLAEQIEDIWIMEIEPYLEEYFFNQPDKDIRIRSLSFPLSGDLNNSGETFLKSLLEFACLNHESTA